MKKIYVLIIAITSALFILVGCGQKAAEKKVDPAVSEPVTESVSEVPDKEEAVKEVTEEATEEPDTDNDSETAENENKPTEEAPVVENYYMDYPIGIARDAFWDWFDLEKNDMYEDDDVYSIVPRPEYYGSKFEDVRVIFDFENGADQQKVDLSEDGYGLVHLYDEKYIVKVDSSDLNRKNQVWVHNNKAN